MKYLLDDERLEGPHSVTVSLRPSRVGRVIARGDTSRLFSAIELSCQTWGGAASPMIPLETDMRVSGLYRDQLRGAAIDSVEGLRLDRYSGDDVVDQPGFIKPIYRDQFAYVFLDEDKRDSYFPVSVPVLAPDDPWRLVYAACLGYLPEQPDSVLLHNNRLIENLTFERFIGIDRVDVVGSADDLMSRLSSVETSYPRAMAMNHLAYGLAPNTGIRTGGSSSPIPNGRFTARDAGPNIIVICAENDVTDIAYLWNLRAAHGDRRTVPLGLLRGSFDESIVGRLINDRGVSLQGIAAKPLYMTSTSVPLEELRSLVSGESHWHDSVEIVGPQELAELGPFPSRHRNEVAVWTRGRATVLPISPEDRSALDIGGRSWSEFDLKVDLRVTDSPLPTADDLRAGRLLSTGYFAGSLTTTAGTPDRSGTNVEWPSRLLMLKLICHEKNLEVASSDAGTPCLTLLGSLDHLSDLDLFAHAPLIDLLEDMSQRQGTAWAKAHLRRREMQRVGKDKPTDDKIAVIASRVDEVVGVNVAPLEDDLPEVDFNKFAKVLGSHKGASSWLTWAESHRLVVKGFPIQCDKCSAKQWIPVTGFHPPVTCRGCALVIERPFPRDTVSFKYRLGESLRRVFEVDAMSHLLLLRYFHRLFDRSAVGLHPGLDISRPGEPRLGEADVLLLLGDGSCIPAEVKRSFNGMDAEEVRKLDVITEALRSPWSVVAVRDFAKNAPGHFASLQNRGERPGPHRMLLTYDRLLDMQAFWGKDDDPFGWSVITDEANAERESQFEEWVKNIRTQRRDDWLEADLLYRSPVNQSDEA